MIRLDMSAGSSLESDLEESYGARIMPSDKSNQLLPTTVLSQDVLAHALKGQAIPAEGVFSPSDLPRLTAAIAGYRAPLRWRLLPDETAAGKGVSRLWWLEIHADLECTCSRCLTPMAVSLDLRRGLEFCRSAKEADEKTEQWLADQADGLDQPDVDFLAPEDEMTVLLLVEDEVLLGLPMTPRHEDCQAPAAARQSPRASDTAFSEERGTERPFAGLKDLLKKPS
jgi:uncharacterized protein